MATNGERALSIAFGDPPPDLILLDIMMPGMNGYEVCRRLKADERTKEVPVVFITALDDVASKVKGFETGGTDYISKPFEPLEVHARVKSLLEAKAFRDAVKRKPKPWPPASHRRSSMARGTRSNRPGCSAS